MAELGAHQPPKLAYVHELEGLRGYLAIWVVISHIISWLGLNRWTPPRRLTAIWLDFTDAKGAVETFIILSGFAISVLLDRKHPTFVRFMIGRFFRIYPSYMLCLFLGLITIPLASEIYHEIPWRKDDYIVGLLGLSVLEQAHFWPHLLAHLTLTHGMIPKRFLSGASLTILPPSWSITLEWQYYLVAPLLARAIRHGSTLIGVGILTWLGIHYSRFWANPLMAFLLPFLPLFLIGIGSFHLYKYLSTDQNREVASATPIAAMLGVIFLVAYQSSALAIWSIAFGCIFVGANDRDPFSRFLKLVSRILKHPVSIWLGKISYPMYLVHWPLIIITLYAIMKWIPNVSKPLASVLLVGVGAPFVILSAYLIHRYIERPAMLYGKRF